MINLKRIIKAIIKDDKKIKKGVRFSTHTIIFMLLEDYDDDYFIAGRTFSSRKKFHSEISKAVGKTGLVRQDSENELSKNIRGNFTLNSSWVKIR